MRADLEKSNYMAKTYSASSLASMPLQMKSKGHTYKTRDMLQIYAHNKSYQILGVQSDTKIRGFLYVVKYEPCNKL